MTFAQLEQLWIAQGGDPAFAPIMAAIAMAESSGDVTNTTGDNGTSWGLWQIHYPVHPQFNPPQLLGAGYNANAAIQLSGLAAGNNGGPAWFAKGANTPWTTWNSYVLGDGGHGDQVISQLLGPYSGSTSTASSSTSSSPAASSSSASGAGASSTSTGPSWLDQIGQLKIGPFAVGPGAEQIVAGGIVTAGALVLLLIGGLWLILGNDKSRTIVVNTAKTAALAAE